MGYTLAVTVTRMMASDIDNKNYKCRVSIKKDVVKLRLNNNKWLSFWFVVIFFT